MGRLKERNRRLWQCCRIGIFVRPFGDIKTPWSSRTADTPAAKRHRLAWPSTFRTLLFRLPRSSAVSSQEMFYPSAVRSKILVQGRGDESSNAGALAYSDERLPHCMCLADCSFCGSLNVLIQDNKGQPVLSTLSDEERIMYASTVDPATNAPSRT